MDTSIERTLALSPDDRVEQADELLAFLDQHDYQAEYYLASNTLLVWEDERQDLGKSQIIHATRQGVRRFLLS